MRWRFYPGPDRSDRDAEREARERRAAALRIGNGLEVEFSLAWTTGSDAAVEVGAASPTSVRWVLGVLLPSYGPGRWRPVSPGARPWPSSPGVRYGVGRWAAEASPREFEASPWPEGFLGALASLPSGTAVEWTLSAAGPAPAGAEGQRMRWTRAPPGYRREADLPASRWTQEQNEIAQRLPRWTAALKLVSADGFGTGSTGRRLERLLVLASSVPGAPRLEFRSSWRWRALLGPSLLLSERGVVDLLPSSRTRAPVPRDPRETVGWQLDLGTGAGGESISVPIEAHQGRHLAILGETGMGKTTLLLRLASRATEFANVALLDPVGDTGRAFLAGLSPSDWSRVLWVSPTDSPISLDLIDSLRTSRAGSVDSERRLGDLVDALRRVRAGRYADTPFWGPRIEETVRRALAATAAIPGASLEDAVGLLDSVGRRAVGVPPEAQASVQRLRERARERPEEVDGARRLLLEILDRPILRRMLGRPGAEFSASDAFVPGRILVVTGDAAQAGEASARYLLAVYLALLWSERVARPEAPKTFLVLDEAQWFAHESTAEVLRLGRRANLHLLLATQSLGSLPEAVRDAVLTNAADLVVFRGSPTDARDLARLLPGAPPDRFWGLGRGTAVGLLGKGEQVVELLVPPTVGVASSRGRRARAAAVDASRRFWGRDGDPIERSANGRSEAPPTPLSPAEGVRREILLSIWSELLDQPTRASISVRPGALRDRFDPEGGEVRSLGRSLRDAGALVATGRDAEGTVWEVGRDGLERLLGPGVDPVELRAAADRARARPAPSGPDGRPA